MSKFSEDSYVYIKVIDNVISIKSNSSRIVSEELYRNVDFKYI